jgi:hypothetical protein
MGSCFTKNIDINLSTLSFTPLREKYKKNIKITIKIYITNDKYFNKK